MANGEEWEEVEPYEERSIWSFSRAKLKCSEKHTCFVEVETEEHICLLPCYIGRIKLGVKEQIEKKILRWKFLSEYGGIIIAYDNIILLQRSAEIHDESPFLHFDIKINYIIFKPEIGKKLMGVVNKTSASHVGCLVHGQFNASLEKPKSCKNGWFGDTLKPGTKFVFRISDIRTVAGVLSIAGYIKEKDMKYIRNGETHSDVHVNGTKMKKNSNHNCSKKTIRSKAIEINGKISSSRDIGSHSSRKKIKKNE